MIFAFLKKLWGKYVTQSSEIIFLHVHKLPVCSSFAFITQAQQAKTSLTLLIGRQFLSTYFTSRQLISSVSITARTAEVIYPFPSPDQCIWTFQ